MSSSVSEADMSVVIDEANQLMDRHSYVAAKAMLKGARTAAGGLDHFSCGLVAAFTAALERCETVPLSPEEMTTP